MLWAHTPAGTCRHVAHIVGTGSGVLATGIIELLTCDKAERAKQARKQRLPSSVVATHVARHAPRVAAPGHHGQVICLAMYPPPQNTSKALKNAKKKKDPS